MQQILLQKVGAIIHPDLLTLISVKKVILFNPRSARAKHRIPNSILQVGASIHGKFDYVLVDGNLEKDPWMIIKKYLDTGEFGYFGCTVMPAPSSTKQFPIRKEFVTNIQTLKQFGEDTLPLTSTKV